MDRTETENEVTALRKHIEEAFGQKITGPKSYDALQNFISRRTGQYISTTTLKRIWGYIDEPLKTRETTLSLLAQSIGYTDWKNFINRREGHTVEKAVQSSPHFGRNIDVLKDLKADDELILYWNPGRECHVRYLGDMRFEVLASAKTRLKPGTTFVCHLILAGHPLYLSSVVVGNSAPMAYICGKLNGGIQFEVLKK